MDKNIFQRIGASVIGMKRIGAVLVAAVFAAGCNDLLNVDNPGIIQEGQLADSALQQLIVNGAIGEFQNAYGLYAEWSGVMSDEVFTDHTNVGTREVAHHDFNDLNDVNESVYSALQRARQSADDAVERFKEMFGDRAGSNLNVARVLAYGGYSYVLLGEGFCESPVNLSAPLSSDELLGRAIAHFDSAITIASTALSGGEADAAQDIIYMSQVGAARAALKLGDPEKARTYAVAVPTDYEKYVYYSENSVDENNPLKNATANPGGSFGIGPRYLDLNDPRVPQLDEPMLGLNANPIFQPQRPMMYSDWSPSTVQLINLDTDILFATGLEATYILAEADGPTASTLSFVNERRAVGGEGSVSLSGDELMAELREQRARDFFLTGQRLGDLRRYAEAGIDLFPSGAYPTGAGVYGDLKCFLVPRSEKTGNPNY
jgi:hypothetical protein